MQHLAKTLRRTGLKHREIAEILGVRTNLVTYYLNYAK